MKSDTLNAKEIMQKNGYSCVLCSGEVIYTSGERGVKPLLGFIEKDNCRGFCAADKIIGKAAAMLYVILGVSEVYADVMSEAGLNILTEHEISAHYDTLTKEIRNRQDTDICPMDKAVQNISEPLDALEAIKKRLSEMIRNNK